MTTTNRFFSITTASAAFAFGLLFLNGCNNDDVTLSKETSPPLSATATPDPDATLLAEIEKSEMRGVSASTTRTTAPLSPGQIAIKSLEDEFEAFLQTLPANEATTGPVAKIIGDLEENFNEAKYASDPADQDQILQQLKRSINRLHTLVNSMRNQERPRT